MITQENAQAIFDEGRSISSLRQTSRYYSSEPIRPELESAPRIIFPPSNEISEMIGCEPVLVDTVLQFLTSTKNNEKLSLLSNEIESLITRAVLTIPEIGEQISKKYNSVKLQNEMRMKQYYDSINNHKRSLETSKTLDDRAEAVKEQYALMCEHIESKIVSLPFSIFNLTPFEQKIVRGMNECIKKVNMDGYNIVEFDIEYIKERKFSYETVINLLKKAGVVS